MGLYSPPGTRKSEEGCQEAEGAEGCWRGVLEDSLCSLSAGFFAFGCSMVVICIDYDIRFCRMLCYHAEKKNWDHIKGLPWFTFMTWWRDLCGEESLVVFMLLLQF